MTGPYRDSDDITRRLEDLERYEESHRDIHNAGDAWLHSEIESIRRYARGTRTWVYSILFMFPIFFVIFGIGFDARMADALTLVPPNTEAVARHRLTTIQDDNLCSTRCDALTAPADPAGLAWPVSRSCYWQAGGVRVCTCYCGVQDDAGERVVRTVTIEESR